MGMTISFTAAVWEKYGGVIERVAANFIDENYICLEIGSRRIPMPDDVALSGFELNRIIAYDAPGDKVEFDAIMIAHMDLFKFNHYEPLEDKTDEWLRVSCEVELDNGCVCQLSSASNDHQ